MAPSPQRVVVVTGAGGIGLAVARRLAAGRKVILGSYPPETLPPAKELLESEGYDVQTVEVDVSDLEATKAFAATAAAAGDGIEAIVHTAGVSPMQVKSAAPIWKVDLLGTAHMMDAFLPYVQPGASMVCISSMASYTSSSQISKDLERHFAQAPTAKLLEHPEIIIDATSPIDIGLSYCVTKLGNRVRVEAAARAWGLKGARINTISPGLISTGMGRSELQSPSGPMLQRWIDSSPAGRIGAAHEIANVVAFLTSSEASFITGVDLLVDGGVTSNNRWAATEAQAHK